MVKRDAIIQFCNEYLNIDAFSDYGPKGLQFLGKAEVNKIVTGVSVSRELFAAAAEAQADMILVHHGEFWNNMSQRVDRVRKQRLIILFEHD
ncbi:MAG TPA: Nif3-like dinuclear metal center hexameric protein, partial [bacterium]|nr:Nif3-like dinuclear metal center hexameric protein [bacterium]